jgi:hypothetical protein
MKHSLPIRLPLLVLAMASACLTLADCSCPHTNSISGTYVPPANVPADSVVMQKLEFGSGGQATVTMQGQKVDVTYKVDGNKVLLNVSGQQLPLDIDKDGCLNGGDTYGKLCKL